MNAKLKEIDEDQYEETLTEVYGTFKMGSFEFDAGAILRELDPTAFRCGMSDEPETWICGECDDEHETEDEANECCKEDETEPEPST